MSDATIIVQHLASVAIFCCCFVAIFTGRVSPVAIVGWASLCTLLAWALWDYWMGQQAVPHSSDTGSLGSNSSSESTAVRRNRQRLTTAKSAALIYAALLGLSPILKSLTRSTTSDSIWALSTWLLLMNVAFFDYSGGPGAQWVCSILSHTQS
jgi:phosphatidylinositol glycan class C protein